MDQYTIDLLLAARQGNITAFEHVYSMFKDKVYALSLSTLKNPYDAEDATQQTFIRVYENLNSLNDLNAFNTWIQRIAINESMMILRKRKVDLSLDDEAVGAAAEQIEDIFLLPQAYVERSDLSARLREIIDDLPTVQRQALVMQMYNNLTMAEIAQIMDCSENTVKSRIRYAKATIKTEIEERERRSGEKFYGVALLPFDLLYKQLVQLQSMPPTVAAQVWSHISQHISVGAAGFSGKAGGTAAAKTGITLAAKIAIVIAVGAVIVGAAVIGLAQLLRSAEHEPAPAATAAAQATEPPATQAATQSPTEPETQAPSGEEFTEPELVPTDPPQTEAPAVEQFTGDLSPVAGIYTSPNLGYGRGAYEITGDGKVISEFPPVGDSPEQFAEFYVTSLSPVEQGKYLFSFSNGSEDHTVTIYMSGYPIANVTEVSLDGWLISPEDKELEYLPNRILITEGGMLRVASD